MLEPVYTKQFERDVKLAKRRGKDLRKLKNVIEMLLATARLPRHYRDHGLIGNYHNRRECHLEPDWLLIYALRKGEIVFERTGTHSDLFK